MKIGSFSLKGDNVKSKHATDAIMPVYNLRELWLAANKQQFVLYSYKYLKQYF